MSDPKEQAARVKLEAYALRAVLDLDTGDRPDACNKLEAAAYALRPWLVAVRREVTAAPAVGLPALWKILDRPELDKEAAALKAAQVDFQTLNALDPADARRAYETALDDTKRAGVLACVRSARRMLDEVEAAATDAARRARMLDAVGELTRPQAEGDAPLADEWQAHLDAMKDPEPGPEKVLRLDKRRGPWGAWFNAWLGERGGLEPGETLILGGAWGAGKTSLAALFAVDALAVGCPVLFWQLELGRARMLEHLQAQRPDLAGWPALDFWGRARADLPPAWADLLTVPRFPKPEVEAVLEALQAQAHRARNLRHACKGLVIVDYSQLLTVAAAGPRQAGHEILTTAASWLAKAADESGACVLLLSQVNKGNQQTGIAGGTALAGADLARMGSRVAIVQKVNRNGEPYKDGGESVDKCRDKGERRRLTWWKARGVRYAPDGTPPADEMDFWTGGQSRALHGGDMAAPAGKAWIKV